MNFDKIDLTEVVDKMAQAATDKSGDEGTWEDLPPSLRQHVRQAMLDLLLPGTDAFEAAVRHAVAEEIRAVAVTHNTNPGATGLRDGLYEAADIAEEQKP